MDDGTLQSIGTTYITTTLGNDYILLKDAATIDVNIENLLYNIDNQDELIIISQRDTVVNGTSKNDMIIIPI